MTDEPIMTRMLITHKCPVCNFLATGDYNFKITGPEGVPEELHYCPRCLFRAIKALGVPALEEIAE